jgi:hypothetical protein
MEAVIPDYVTHYFMASRPPFLNLSDLSEEALDTVMEHLAGERQSGQSLVCSVAGTWSCDDSRSRRFEHSLLRLGAYP